MEESLLPSPQPAAPVFNITVSPTFSNVANGGSGGGGASGGGSGGSGGESRHNQEVDVVSGVRINICLQIGDKMFECEPFKKQVKRTDTVATLAAAVMVEANVERLAAVHGGSSLISFFVTQGGVKIGGDESAALLFDDKYSNSTSLVVTYVFSVAFPVCTMCQCIRWTRCRLFMLAVLLFVAASVIAVRLG